MLTLDDSRKISLPVGGQPLELPEPGLVVALKVKSDLLYNQIIRPWKSRLGLHYIAHQSLWLDIFRNIPDCSTLNSVQSVLFLL